MVKVIVPQIGQSIAEATIVKWFKKPGDSIEKGETLLEIGTDKVNTEIPAPETGIVAELLAKEDEVVPVGAEIAIIRQAGETQDQKSGSVVSDTTESMSDQPKSLGLQAAAAEPASRYSPIVRKLAQEYNIDLTGVSGSGEGGRISREDLMKIVQSRSSDTATTASGTKASTRRVPMSRVRKLIAEHMSSSRRTAADVTTFFEIDMSQVVAQREKARERYDKQHQIKLTYLPFIIHAVVKGLRAFPVLNSSVENDEIIYKDDIHIGIAVAVEEGLVVPVIRNADRKSILDLALAAQDLSQRTRSKRLTVEDLEDGTFTITNPGVFGALMGTPIIHQPQVAILGVGAVVKRPMVLKDAVVIRSMAYFSLSYDHRALDGSTADGFLAHVKRTLEEEPAEAE